ncbi:WG repeat-containing protein [Brevibacillus sp. NRS-1366]|uniref:WG repeat-containing protein n=1 Tax=Brevibacillus sp. NRS-1366 TaxID=3233899 RepID=UPI003D1B86DC
MKKQITNVCMAVMLGVSAWSTATTVQAASFSTLQPYVTDYKIGFTNGNALVTKPVYDEFTREFQYLIVTKAGKKGILEAKTGKEVTPTTWDSVEIPGGKNIAIVQKGGWFQYLDLSTRKLSTVKFAGAHSYFLSPAHETVIVMGGQTSMVLDSSGKVLIPPFAGKLSVVGLVPQGQTENQDAIPLRYIAAVNGKQLTLYDGVTLKPRFSLAKTELILNEGGPNTAYLKVRSGGKEGLVDVDGKYVLEPKYNALYTWANGYFQVVGPKGVGLWKDGKMLAEPQYSEVGMEFTKPDMYTTAVGDTMTYHSATAGTSTTMKKGAQYLRDGYVLGQDPKTGMYGVIQVGGKTVIPFTYPNVEGPPAARLLVRSDGKKGILPGYGLPMKEPDFWFDQVTTLGSYSMLAIKDGTKIGLYSDSKGLLLPPQENTVIRYDEKLGRVLVTGPDGKTNHYNELGIVGELNTEKVQPLTDRLATSGSLGNGAVIIDRETNQPISKKYQAVYIENNSKQVVGLDAGIADLYTPEGKLLTTDIKVPNGNSGNDAPPLMMIEVAGAFYTIGEKAGSSLGGLALTKLENEQLQPISDFVYRSFASKMVNGKNLLILGRTDGTMDIWAQEGNQVVQKLSSVSGIDSPEGQNNVFIKNNSGWDVYSTDLGRLTTGNYLSLKPHPASNGKQGAIVYQDEKTGLYGFMTVEGKPLTVPKYGVIRPTNEVFPQYWPSEEKRPPFLFTTNQQFGYLDENGQELFTTAFLTKKPAITYRPLNLQGFTSYTDLIRQNPLELIEFDKPYSWPVGGSSEQKFFANLALYLNLPKEAGKKGVLAELVSKGILKADADRAGMNDDDLFALLYFMATGKTSQALNTAQLWEWAQKRGLVIERGGHNYYQTMDLYAEHYQRFFQELTRSLSGKKAVKAKVLSLGNLSFAQQQMLTPMIMVNGKAWNELMLPLPEEEWRKAANGLIAQYNKQVAGLLGAYLAH